MKKNTFSRLSALAVLTVLFAACSEQTNYTDVIPSDALMVASIDPKALAQKAGLNSEENTIVQQQMLNALKSEMSANAFQQLEKIIQNPAESGIDTEVPMYLFSSADSPAASLVAKVNNENALNASIEALVSEQIAQPITQADDYSYTTIDNNVLAFNQSAVLFAASQSSNMERIAELMKQTPENSITKTGAFRKMNESKGDLKYLASMEQIPSLYKKFGIPFPQQLSQWKDLTAIGGLSFENGEIVFTSGNYTENEETKALLKKLMEAMKQPANAFNKYLPAATLLHIFAAIDGSKMYDLFVEQYELLKKVEETMEDPAQKKAFGTGLDFLQDENVKAILSSIDGDVTLSITNMTMNMPAAIAYAQVKDASALEKLYQNKQNLKLNGGDIVELAKNEYAYKLGFLTVYFGVKDNTMYVTNDENVYRNFGKEEAENIEKAPYAAEMANKSMFFAINVGAILDLPVVKMAANFGGKEAKMYVDLASKISYFSTGSEGENSKFVLHLKDEQTNALKQIVDIAKQFAGM